MMRLRQRRPRLRDKGYLAFLHDIRVPCILTGCGGIELAHIKGGDPRMGCESSHSRRPDDWRVLPLRADLHQGGRDAQHSNGERRWWAARGIAEPLMAAAALHLAYLTVEDDYECERAIFGILEAWRQQAEASAP